MKWNNQQESALRKVSKWLKNPGDQKVFRLSGFAGTGKSTLAKHLAEGLNDVIFMTFTGKAAHVLRGKGCPLASTVHSAIYRNKGNKSEATLLHLQQLLAAAEARAGESDKRDEELVVKIANLRRAVRDEQTQVKKPRFELNQNSALKFCDLAVVDEASMIGSKIGLDIESFGCPVLALGDPFQLPPVKDVSHFLKGKPDVLLTDVERQARDSPVLYLATEIRSGRELKIGKYGESEVFRKKDLANRVELAENADQILVGRNGTRKAVNKRIREIKGFTDELPMEGDKVVCLRNNHDIGILNGSIWHVIGDPCSVADVVSMRLEADGEPTRIEVAAWADTFLGKDIEGSWWERSQAEEFDFGNGITVHKAQGSQYQRVLQIDESSDFGRAVAPKHQYTGLTRASDVIHVAI